MADSHTVEHGEIPFANCVVFEDLADEEWRVLLLMLSPSLAVAFIRHSRKSCYLKIEVARSETNTYNLNSLCLRMTVHWTVFSLSKDIPIAFFLLVKF